jgi:hypothetical protein
MALFLGHVDLLTAGTKDLDSRSADVLAHADGQYMLAFAEDTGTDAENSLQVLFLH